jgi:hypothetical protein
MVDGLPKSVVVLLGPCVPKRKQGEEVRCARILTDLSDYRVCIGRLAKVLPLHQGQMLV